MTEETGNWVRERAECTTPGFLRNLRESISADVIEANRQFEPEKSFSLSCADEPDLKVFCRIKGEEQDAVFVVYKRAGDCALSAFYYAHNGSGRALYSEQPLGRVDLEWDRRSHSCAIKLCGEPLSLVDLRRKTLGKLFFGD